jgi:hypothetical protein
MRSFVSLALALFLLVGSSASAAPAFDSTSVSKSCNPPLLFPAEMTCEGSAGLDGRLGLESVVKSPLGAQPAYGRARVDVRATKTFALTQRAQSLTVEADVVFHSIDVSYSGVAAEVDGAAGHPLLFGGEIWLAVGIEILAPCAATFGCRGFPGQVLLHTELPGERRMEDMLVHMQGTVTDGATPGRLFAGTASASVHVTSILELQDQGLPDVGEAMIKLDASVESLTFTPSY